MKKGRKLRYVITGMLILSTMFTGCGQSQSTSTDKVEGIKEGETVKIEVMAPHFGGLPEGTPVQEEWVRLMEEKLGVKLEFVWNYIPYAEFNEKINISLAADDFPDILGTVSKSQVDIYADQGMFVELSEYKDQMPNYMKMVEKVQYGMERITNQDGEIFGFQNMEVPRLEQGIGIYTMPAYRYDVFEKEGIKIPETIDEFYSAAKALKEKYPNKYPVNGAGSWASAETKIFKTSDDIFWNGSEFIYGPVTENYKDMLTFLNKLYQEGLLDPEFYSEDADTHTKKALNGDTFMQLGEWFNTTTGWTNNEQSDAMWVNALAPTNPKYGMAWQDVSNVNEYSLGSGVIVINSRSKNKELLIKLCDLQYDEDVIELLTWGIEGESFIRDDEGNPTFIDSIKNAENPWQEGDKYGMRASASYRPGLQLAIDTKAFIDFAPNDYAYINGQFVETPWEKAFPDEDWPNSEMIPPHIFAPPVAFTSDENQEKSNVMTAVSTYVAETKIQFIKGEKSLDEWDDYVAQVGKMGDYQQILDMYNEKAANMKK